MADEQTAPSPAQVFALRLFAQVCDGPRTLRDRLLSAGLDTLTIARVVEPHLDALAIMAQLDSPPDLDLIGVTDALSSTIRTRSAYPSNILASPNTTTS